jgi:hypothetical protein
MLLIAGLMNGMADRMLEAVTGSFLGHAQIHLGVPTVVALVERVEPRDGDRFD